MKNADNMKLDGQLRAGQLYSEGLYGKNGYYWLVPDQADYHLDGCLVCVMSGEIRHLSRFEHELVPASWQTIMW